MGNMPQSVKNKVIDESQSKLMIAIIDSMTPKERTHIKLIKGSRKQRIANGSGTNIQQVNKLLKQFEKMQKTMKKMSGGKMKKMMQQMNQIQGEEGMPDFSKMPGGLPGMSGKKFPF
jgi:signal recognition particle subunit SRP54